MKSLSVLLVEDSALFRSALSRTLSRTSMSVTCSGSSRSMDLKSEEYDAVVIDIATFPGSDQQLSEVVRMHLKFGPILLLARLDRMGQVITGLKSGATGVVQQTASEHELFRAIRAVGDGSAWLDRHTLQKLTSFLLPVNEWHEARYSKREAEVLRCVSRGQTNKEIASCLGVSEQSVKVYISNLLRKTGVPNRGGLALHALVLGA